MNQGGMIENKLKRTRQNLCWPRTVAMDHNKKGGHYCDCKECMEKYSLIQDEEDPRLVKFDKPLPCFGCGIGWCSLLLGCLCPFIWYVAAILYLCKYYNRDPRERTGLASCALAALVCSVAIGITLAVIFL